MGSHKHKTTKSPKTLERIRLQKIDNYRSMQAYHEKQEHALELSKQRARRSAIEAYFGPWEKIPEGIKAALSMMTLGDIKTYGETFVKSLDLHTPETPTESPPVARTVADLFENGELLAIVSRFTKGAEARRTGRPVE